jgi:Fe2+ transport system protein FeoA
MQRESYPEKNLIYHELANSGHNDEYLIVPLTDLKAGQNGIIVSIDEVHSDGCRQLIEMGVSLRSNVRVFCNQFHHLIFDVNRIRIAADRHTAMKIKVQISYNITGIPAANPL